jgi:hypothetical protein
MQIIYAAPFLLTAAILFTILAAIPKTRRFAITVPTGIIASGPGCLAGYIAFVLTRAKIWGHDFPADRWDIMVYILSGLCVLTLAAFVARLVLAAASTLVIRIIIFAGAFCSYFILIISAMIGLHAYFTRHQFVQPSNVRGAVMLCLSLLLSCLGAWFISRHPNEFKILKKLPTIVNVPTGE